MFGSRSWRHIPNDLRSSGEHVEGGPPKAPLSGPVYRVPAPISGPCLAV
jgi:hypothetical protein